MFTVSNVENRCVVHETSTALQQGTDQNITTSQRVVSCLMFKGILSKSKVYNIIEHYDNFICFFNFFMTSERMITGCLSGNTRHVCQRLHLHAADEATQVLPSSCFSLNGFIFWECWPLITKKIKICFKNSDVDVRQSLFCLSSLHWLS